MPLQFQTIFKAIKESPLAAITTLCIMGMATLFGIDHATNKSIQRDLKKANKDCATEKYVVQAQMERLNEKHIETFGLLRELQGQINTLKALKKIE